ncbi:hypothetical protein Hanom_Chr15g01371931 [Helianthus anomalus]
MTGDLQVMVVDGLYVAAEKWWSWVAVSAVVGVRVGGCRSFTVVWFRLTGGFQMMMEMTMNGDVMVRRQRWMVRWVEGCECCRGRLRRVRIWPEMTVVTAVVVGATPAEEAVVTMMVRGVSSVDDELYGCDNGMGVDVSAAESDICFKLKL